MIKTENILKLIPDNLKKIIPEDLRSFESVSGIRLKAGSPAYLTGPEEKTLSDTTVCFEDIERIITSATENSLYAYIDGIRNGYITVKGGHRLGICGRAVYEDGKLKNVKNISYINIRISRQVKGAAIPVMKYISSEVINGILIISPPGGGKTTLLRDLARILGNTPGTRPAVIDSRCEIGAEFEGVAYNDTGERTFLLSGYSRSDGFSHAIRALSPDIILCDEIGGEEDARFIFEAAFCGVRVIATAHGTDVEGIKKRKGFAGLIGDVFGCAVILDNREIKQIIKL